MVGGRGAKAWLGPSRVRGLQDEERVGVAALVWSR